MEQLQGYRSAGNKHVPIAVEQSDKGCGQKADHDYIRWRPVAARAALEFQLHLDANGSGEGGDAPSTAVTMVDRRESGCIYRESGIRRLGMPQSGDADEQ